MIALYLVYLANVLLFALPALYLAAMPSAMRRIGLYAYMAVTLMIAMVLSGIYSYPLTPTIDVAGGTVAYGAFMMTSVMLFIIERREFVFYYFIRLLLVTTLFSYIGFELLAYLLSLPGIYVAYPLTQESFDVSPWQIFMGSAIILLQFLLMLAGTIACRRVRSPHLFIWCQLGIFNLTMLLAALLFFGTVGEQDHYQMFRHVDHHILGQLVVSLSFSMPLLGFYYLYPRGVAAFRQAPLSVQKLVFLSRRQLLQELHENYRRTRKLRREYEELAEQSVLDSLTGLTNRRGFDDVFEAQWRSAMELEQPFTLVLGDIDCFKLYNDNYGHQQGDECLAKVGQLWGQFLSQCGASVTARIGGEELAALFPNKGMYHVRTLVRRFEEQLAALALVHTASTVVPRVSMSIGIATHFQARDSSASALFAKADDALYEAKSSGRNRIVCASLRNH